MALMGGRGAMAAGRGAGMSPANVYMMIGLIDMVTPVLHNVQRNTLAWTTSMQKHQAAWMAYMGPLHTVLDTMDAIGMVSLATVGVMAGGFAVASRASLGFEQQLVNMNSILMASDDVMWQLGERAVALSTQYNKSADDIAAGMYHLASAGLTFQEILDVLTPTLQLAVATQGDYTKIAKDVVQVIKGFSMEMSEANHVADVMIWTIQHSLVTWDKLGEGIKFALPWFTAAGLSFEELAAAVGVLTDRALEAGIGGRGLRQSLAMLIREASQNTDKFEEMGISIVDATGNILPLLDILKQFRAAHPEMNVEAIADMMELLGIRGATAFSHLVVGMEDYEYKLEGVRSATNLVSKVADTQMEATAAKLKVLRHTLEAPFKTEAFAAQVGNLVDLLMPLAKEMGPMLVSLMMQIGNALEWIVDGGAPLAAMLKTMIVLGKGWISILMGNNALLLRTSVTIMMLNRVMGISAIMSYAMSAGIAQQTMHLQGLTIAEYQAAEAAHNMAWAQMGVRGALGGTALALLLVAKGADEMAVAVGVAAVAWAMYATYRAMAASAWAGPAAIGVGIAMGVSIAALGAQMRAERIKMEREMAVQSTELERIKREAQAITATGGGVPATAIGHEGGPVEETGWAYIKKGERLLPEDGGLPIEINIDLRDSVVTNEAVENLSNLIMKKISKDFWDKKRLR